VKSPSLILASFLTAISGALAQPQPPVQPRPIPAPSPFPAGSAVFQWDYVCPINDASTCGATASTLAGATVGSTNGVRSFTLVLALVRVGSQQVPTYFYWIDRVPKRKNQASQVGFVQNAGSFSLTAFGAMRLQYAGPAASPPL
jgi:hypothetical protein